MHIVIGLIGMIVGVLIVWKSRFLVRALGDISFAEQYLGSGGTYTFYVLAGVALIIVFALYMFGLLHFSLPSPVTPQ